ncbi:MAG: DUF3316 domain-containing protein [Paludibacter sp.]
MNKIRILIFLLLATLAALAQTSDEKKYLLTSKTNSYYISTLSFLDPYLSPITYRGLGLGYNSESRRFLNVTNTDLSTLSKLRFTAGIAINPEITSDLLYFGANYGYGIEYRFIVAKGLKLQVGGLWDVDFGLKNMERNINNPVNLDMATNLNITGLAMYDIPLRRKVLKLKLSLQTPFVGCMFVPKAGASYYEMFDLGNLTDAFHFSSLHNKRGLLGTFSIDVPFNRSIWNFGLRMNNLRYTANNLVFNRSEYSLLIGTTFDVINFAGRKNKAPKNFISPND